MGSASVFTGVAQIIGADAQQDCGRRKWLRRRRRKFPNRFVDYWIVDPRDGCGWRAGGKPQRPGDLRFTGALTAADLFRTIPQFNNVIPGPVGTQAANNERGTRVNLRQLDTGSAPRSLMMVDGVRYPPQGAGLCQIDPSIIPEVAIDRIDLLLDGASATYGSDAIGGVVNVILKRNFDGAVTEVGFTAGAGGNQKALASQLYGRTWDGGDIVIGINWYNINPTQGNFNSKYTFDFSPWGLDNRTPLASAIPGIISSGKPASPDPTNYPATNGNNCTNCFSISQGNRRRIQSYPIMGWVHIGGGSAATLNWAAFATAANGGTVSGTRNEFNPYAITTYSAGQQFIGSELTIDQRLFPGVSFYGEGIYGLRRSNFIATTLPAISSPSGCRRSIPIIRRAPRPTCRSAIPSQSNHPISGIHTPARNDICSGLISTCRLAGRRRPIIPKRAMPSTQILMASLTRRCSIGGFRVDLASRRGQRHYAGSRSVQQARDDSLSECVLRPHVFYVQFTEHHWFHRCL